MKKNILFLLLSLFVSIFINAQKGSNYLKLNAGAELTIKSFADGYKSGWGIYATDYYNITDDLSILFSTGVTSFESKRGAGKAGMSLTRAGFRQFFSKGFYFQGDAGIGIGLKNFNGPTRFAFGFGPGYFFKSKNGNGFDISTRYNGGFNRTWIGLAVGYQFKL